MDQTHPRHQEDVQALILAMGHPVRYRILASLSEEGDASARTLSARTGDSLRSTRHQLERLQEGGLVEVVARKRRRGVLEHSYRLVVPPVIDAEEMAAMDEKERLRVSTEVLKGLFKNITIALSGGTFDSRTDRCLTYNRVPVDERGWQELAELHLRTYWETVRLTEEAAMRLRESGERPIPAVSGLLWFELPPEEDEDSD